MNFQKGIEMAFDDQQRVNSRKKKKRKRVQRQGRREEEEEDTHTHTHDIDSQEPNAIIIEMVKSF